MPNASRLTAATFGILAGLGGIRHGIGEVLQGRLRPDGLFIESWTFGPIAEHMDGEPGLTLIPNMLATGILAIVISSLVVVWSVLFLERRRGGRVLTLLSVAMLLVGGGVGPPIVGVLAGWAGRSVGPGLAHWRGRLAGRPRNLLASAWPWVYGVAIANGIFLFIVSLVLLFVFDFEDAGLLLWSFYFSLVLLVCTSYCAIAFDLRRADGSPSEGVVNAPRGAKAIIAAALVAVFVMAPLLMLLLSLRTYDFGNTRSRINGYLMTRTVETNVPPSDVFDFITYRMEEHNLSIAKAHERFEITEGTGLTLGSRFIAEEWDDDEGVLNEYVVREVVPSRLIHMASTPSHILARDGKGSVSETGTANAYVYFDLEPRPAGTTVTQTVVLEMPNPLVKFIIDVVILFDDSNPWQDHLVEELEGLRAAIERTRP
jgi:hypothetical protein